MNEHIQSDELTADPRDLLTSADLAACEIAPAPLRPADDEDLPF